MEQDIGCDMQWINNEIEKSLLNKLECDLVEEK